MDNLLSLAFEAHHAERNNHQSYAVSIGRDLFDAWTVAIRYGRARQAGSCATPLPSRKPSGSLSAIACADACRRQGGSVPRQCPWRALLANRAFKNCRHYEGGISCSSI
jgi:hypothetical protein